MSKIIPLSATDITFGRSVIACMVLALVVKLSGASLRLNNKKDYLVAIALGLLMSSHWVTYFAAMQYSSVSVGMIALFTFPVIAVLLEPFFEGIRLVWQDVVSALVVFIGIFLIVPEISLENDVTLGILIGILSAVLYAIRNLCHRKYFSHYTGAHAMSYQTLVILVSLLFFVSEDLFTASSETYLWIIVLGIFLTALPHTLIATSLKHLRVKTFALVACMQPFYGVILAIIVLDEKPNWQTFLGGILVISAAIYETVNAQKLHRK
ncbi:membrane protein [Aliiglaciecola lipolytica E3]|uniref:Membrane protein n=2 Tax=Aliiglaciecola TaxID=1406885 RepID=K6X651_9ALTE|nr:membrane protein [Aliiglaciecola lipolytica E3]